MQPSQWVDGRSARVAEAGFPPVVTLRYERAPATVHVRVARTTQGWTWDVSYSAEDLTSVQAVVRDTIAWLEEAYPPASPRAPKR